MKEHIQVVRQGAVVELVYFSPVCHVCHGKKLWPVDARVNHFTVCTHCEGLGVENILFINPYELEKEFHGILKQLQNGFPIRWVLPELPVIAIANDAIIDLAGKTALFPHPHSRSITGAEFKKGSRPSLPEGIE